MMESFRMDQNIKPTFREIKNLAEHDEMTTPLLFHNQNLIQNLKSAKTIKQKELINLWNNHHFTEGTVYVHLHHPGIRRIFSFRPVRTHAAMA